MLLETQKECDDVSKTAQTIASVVSDANGARGSRRDVVKKKGFCSKGIKNQGGLFRSASAAEVVGTKGVDFRG